MKEKLYIQTLQSRRKSPKTLSQLFLLLAMIVYVLMPMQVSAQGTMSAPNFSTQGKDFLVSFGQNLSYTDANITGKSLSLRVRVAVSKPTVVTLYFYADGSTKFETLSAGIHDLEIDPSDMVKMYASRPLNANRYNPYSATSNKSLRITSTEPISIYAMSAYAGTSDATNVLPVDNLGTSYYHISYPAASQSQDNDPLYNDMANYDGFTLIATENGTTIDINGVPKVTLNKGQVYSYYSEKRGTLSGMKITSTYPVAYFTTNTGVRIPNNVTSNDSYGATECLYQQLAPVSAWGRNFVVPVSTRGWERVRIIASENGTTLKINNGINPLTNPNIYYPSMGKDDEAQRFLSLDRGQYVDLDIKIACSIEASHPVGVCSFFIGNTLFIPATETIETAGDPAMAWIPAMEQSIKSTTIANFNIANANPANTTYKALVIVPTSQKTNTKVSINNGAAQTLAAADAYTSIDGSTYSYYAFDMKSNLDAFYTFSSPDGLIVLAYGYGGSESYYYLAGAANRIINPHFTVNGVYHEDAFGTEFCKGDVALIKASITSRRAGSNYLEWYINGVHQPSLNDDEEWVWDTNITPGTYEIEMRVVNALEDIDICKTQLVIKDCYQCPYINGMVYVKDYTNTSKTSGSTSGIGTSWANAHPSLADVLKIAADYPGCITEIWVAEGTYYPKYNAATGAEDNSRDRAFVVPNGVKLIGGFPGNATDALHGKAVIQDVNNAINKRNWAAYPTIMSGNLGYINYDTDNAYHVVILSGATETTEINGFTIQDGNANGFGSITLNNNTIKQNEGGGVNSNNSYAQFLYCTIKNNTAALGGGFYQSGMISGFNTNTISKVTYFSNVLICNNTATTRGGGLYNYDSNGTRFEHVTIAGNTGSAFYIATNGSGVGTYTFYDSISWSNTVADLGGGTVNGGTNRIQGLTFGSSTEHPPYFTLFNYHLSSGSESIDKAAAGTNFRDRTFDLGGNPRESLCHKDLGAYEYQSPIHPTNKCVYVKDYAYYSQSVPANADGSSWALAYPNLADVIRLAEVSYGDCITEIWVTGGKYTPKYALDGKNVIGINDETNKATFNLPAGVSVYGGFAGTENAVSARQNINPLYEISTNVSILSGDVDGSEDDYLNTILVADPITLISHRIYKNTKGNANHVVTSKESKASPATLLDGFTIQGGHAQNAFDGGEESSGGGLYIIGVSTPTLSNLTVCWNTAHNLGGGISDCSEGNKTITNLRVHGNMASRGGGIGKMRSGSLHIYNFDISNNKGDSELPTISEGGGITHGAGDLYLVNGKITGNQSDIGAGIRVSAIPDLGQAVTFKLTNVTIADNLASRTIHGSGGGLAMRTTLVTGTINNSIIWNNKAGVAGTNNLLFESSPTLSTSYSIVEGSGGSASWQTGFGTNGSNNLDVDPQFVGSGTYPYRLDPSSPAIDVASNTLYTGAGGNLSSNKDISGANRLIGSIIDMGAYEIEKEEINLWIGGNGAGKNTTSPNSPTKNNWSVSANWTANRLPRVYETVNYHKDALDLHVNGDYKVAAIDATTSQHEKGLRVLKNASLVLTDTNPVRLGTGELYIEGGDPFSGECNGSFITQANKTINNVTVQMKSRAKNKKVSGDVYDPDVLAWQYFGIPVASTTPNDLFIGAMVRRYDEKAQDGGRYWVTMSKSEQMLPYKGYELAWLTDNMNNNANGIFEFRGNLVNGDYTMSLSYTPNVMFSGYHVVSNPYTAGLSIQDGLTFGSSMENTVYLFHTGSSIQWDEWAAGIVGDGTGEGQYIAVPQNHAGQGPYLPETISSLQGFVVRHYSSSGSNLTFKYSGVQKNTSVLRSDEEKEVKVYTMATLSSTDDENPKDRLWLFTDARATRGFDNGYDGKKMFGSSRLTQLYAVEEDGDYQVNTIPDINNTYLAFKAEEGTLNYTLTFNHQNVWQSYDKIYLIDLEKDSKTLIDITADGASYSFTAYNTDKAVKRFKVVTESSITSVDDLNACGFDIRYLNEEIVISNCEEKADVSIYTATGVPVYKTSLQPYQTEVVRDSFAPGVYMVHAQLPNEKVVRKVVVR